MKEGNLTVAYNNTFYVVALFIYVYTRNFTQLYSTIGNEAILRFFYASLF